MTSAAAPIGGTEAPAEDVRAEIPGTVLSVEAAVGDRVAEGDVIVVLESMKMEIPVVAEVAGRVAQIVVGAGATVRLDDVVANIAPERVRPPDEV